MKVLHVGASGMIGGEALLHCLAHPRISKVVAFVRRPLPDDISDNPKLECVIVADFAVWPDGVLQAHADAAAMIWAMGTYKGSMAVDVEYPVAFMESMGRVLETKPSRPPFRYVQLSGKFVRQNQERKLWLMETPRKIKGLADTRALEFAECHSTIWDTFIVKPAAVVPRNMIGGGTFMALAGENVSVRNEELAAFMTYLAISGKGECCISENLRIVTKGRELLDSQNDKSKS